MSDYSGIGDAMVVLAVVAAFAVPIMIGCAIALVLSFIGFTVAAAIFATAGFVVGTVFAALVGRSA